MMRISNTSNSNVDKYFDAKKTSITALRNPFDLNLLLADESGLSVNAGCVRPNHDCKK